jgi:predicted DNA-binding transcriptional regulator AlpA
MSVRNRSTFGRTVKTSDTPPARVFYTVPEFCRAHAISRSTLYRLVNAGHGPRLTKVGDKTLISIEAARDWAERMERESPAVDLTPRGSAKKAPALADVQSGRAV